MEDLVVIDYSIGEVHIYQIGHDEDVESFIEDKGHRMDDCYYMTGEHIPIHRH